MPAPSTTDELFDLIARSGLLPPDRLTAYRASEPGQTREGLLRRMVADGILTPFQSRHLLAGRYKGFFLSGKYKVLAHLGAGGMGQVYLCEHLMLQRLVAVKLLRPVNSAGGSGAAERFFREARAVAQLDHPNITRLFDMDRSAAFPYMVMEYVDGTNLHAIVAERGALPVNRAVNYVIQAARGLKHAHENGLVHRDVKPGNLLLDRTGTVKVLDLGLARYHFDISRNNNLTAQYDDRNLIGTADFIAPEQTHDSSAVDARADIYSLGCTFYFFLTGRAPFEEGSLAQKLMWHQLKTPVPVTEYRNDVPAELRSVLAKMTAKDPNDRYRTVDDLLSDLAPWQTTVVPPPLADEMPKMSAASYRLGLVGQPVEGTATWLALPTPTPGALSRETQPGSKTGNSSGRAGNGAAGQPPALGRHPPTDSNPNRSAVTDLPVTNPEHVSASRQGRRRWFVFAAAQVVILGVGLTAVWLILWSANVPTVFPPLRQPSRAGPELEAGGSTFLQKLMGEWKAAYAAQTGVKLEYDAVGSGKGVDGVLDGRYAFGCTDAYLTDDQLKTGVTHGMELVHIPLAMGAVVPVYNLPEVRTPLRFSGPLLADIFLGKITKWNDRRIQDENRQTTMPDREIRVVYRSDSSGTTFIWTDFLNKASPDSWGKEMGPPRTRYPHWRVGHGVAKSDGVTAAVAESTGAIGYVELTHALAQKNLSYGWVLNRAGVFVDPSLEGVTEAARQTLIPADLRYTLTDPPGEKSYPISGTTWAVFDARMPDQGRLQTVIDFVWWATHDGQRVAAQLHYAPLPENVVLLLEAKLLRMKPDKK